LFGTDDPNKDGALESMRQGQGIIDIVNSYLEVLIYQGIVGFCLFLIIFFVALYNLYSAVKSIKRNQKICLLGNILIAMIVATLVMIGTVSSVNFIPIYYWSLIGLVGAYIHMCKRHQVYYRDVRSNSEQFFSVDSKLIPEIHKY
jgi:hypothetical protein